MALIRSGLPGPRVETPPLSLENPSLARIIHILGIRQISGESFAESLPFSGRDITAGTENELQAVVIGSKKDVAPPHHRVVQLLQIGAPSS